MFFNRFKAGVADAVFHAAGVFVSKGFLYQQSAEDYFETIYILKKRNGSVRSIDIVNEMGFSKPTVSVAMKKFRENGFVTMDSDGQIELTKQGLFIAEKTYEWAR